MAIRVLPQARDDLRDAIRYYRSIRPPAIGKELAERVLAAFKMAVFNIAATRLSRPEHPDIPGARFVMFPHFPYLAFYSVKDGDVVIVSVDYATSDYIGRVSRRVDLASRGR